MRVCERVCERVAKEVRGKGRGRTVSDESLASWLTSLEQMKQPSVTEIGAGGVGGEAGGAATTVQVVLLAASSEMIAASVCTEVITSAPAPSPSSRSCPT